jgi:hypothetical protein
MMVRVPKGGFKWAGQVYSFTSNIQYGTPMCYNIQ